MLCHYILPKIFIAERINHRNESTADLQGKYVFYIVKTKSQRDKARTCEWLKRTTLGEA